MASGARSAPALKASAAVGLLLAALSFSADAQARMRCAYAAAPVNTLTVTATGESLGQVGTLGQQIVVSESFRGPRPCTGGTPTVLNTDTLRVVATTTFATVDVRLDGGPFAPGATPEPEGAPEIEIEFSGPEAFGTVVGMPRADEFHWGPGGAHPGLNLNPRDAGDQDVDVTVKGGFLGFLIADGGGGRDTIMAAPGAVIREGVFSKGGRGDDRLIAPKIGFSILEGGAGDDVLTGGKEDDTLRGDAGKDRVAGAGGSDEIEGGRGKDLLSGGRGRDSIKAQDSKRDRVKCGPGRDRVKADRRDQLRGCEVISGR
jgi:hypothetical protein